MVKQRTKPAVRRAVRKGRPAAAKRKTAKKWSSNVTQHSNALTLEPEVFKQSSPRRVALSLKRLADSSNRRKATPFQSAMSMLNRCINRAGRGLSASQKAVLQRAKGELRGVFGRKKSGAPRSPK